MSVHWNQIVSSSDGARYVCGGKEITIFAIQNLLMFFSSVVLDCGNIKFHCNMWVDATFSCNTQCRCRFSWPLSFFAYCYRIVLSKFMQLSANSFHPQAISISVYFCWFGAIFIFHQFNCELSTRWLCRCFSWQLADSEHDFVIFFFFLHSLHVDTVSWNWI